MPKKKGQCISTSDFTINDSANAPKPVTRLKKATEIADLAWDEQDGDCDIIEEVDECGTKKFIYKKKKNAIKVDDDIENRPGIVYPEILFYLISDYIKPEEVGTFASINKAAYACTRRESFWRNLYKRYCRHHPRLPQRLRIENSFKIYGLRQRVVRALYHTYQVFVDKITQQATQDSTPHRLVKRRCINVWYRKGPLHWLVYFKLKKVPLLRPPVDNGNMLEELGKIDANPEENCQVLQVSCTSFHEVPPVLGMTLTSVMVVLSPGFQHHRLSLGFSTSSHTSPSQLPEQLVVIDTVKSILVLDWWHPMYPHFDNKLPAHMKDEESMPVLKKDFFNMRVEE